MSAPAQREPSEPFLFRILPAQNLVLVVTHGPLTTYVLADAMTAVYKSPEWQPGFNIVWDMRRISEWLINWEDTRAFIDFDREVAHLSGAGIDVVLVDNDLHFTNVVAYATLSRNNPRTVIPARNIAAAAAEIHLPVHDLARELDAIHGEF